MFKKLLANPIDSVTAAAFLVGASSLASRLLGVVRDRILAGSFGAGDTLDVYYAAFRVPDLIFNLLVLGALSAGFIPVFSNLIKNHKEADNQEAWLLASNILNLLAAALVVLIGLGMIFAPFIMKLATPGFSPEKLAATVKLTRIMFLSPLLLGMSSVLGGILQSTKRFLAYSLSPIFYNLGIIFGAYWLAPRFGMIGLAWGVVLGSCMHALIQLPAVIKLGFRYSPIFNWKNRGVLIILRMTTARTMALAISQISLLVVTVIASTLNSGSLSIFNLANNLQSFPIGIFGISFATAVFPVLAINAFNVDKLVSRLARTIRQILFFIIPAAMIMIMLKAQIVRLILGSGKFDWEDTVLTMNTLSCFAISFFAQALIPLLTRVFYARHNSKTPFLIGLVAEAVNITLALWLARKWGVVGLAMAFSLSNITNFFILAIVLRLELGDLKEKTIGLWALKFCGAALAGAIVIQIVKQALGGLVDMNRVWGVMLQAGLAGLAGLGLYLAICWWLGSPELKRLMQAFAGRFIGKKNLTEDQGEARGI